MHRKGETVPAKVQGTATFSLIKCVEKDNMNSFEKNEKMLEMDSFWIDRPSSLNLYVWFYDSFHLQTLRENMRLYIRADSQYLVWVNGVFAGFGQYADYETHPVFDTYDVTSLLFSGNNTITVLGYCTGENCSIYRAGTPGICCSLVDDSETVFTFSRKTLCKVNEAYESGEIERISPQLSFSFRYHADRDGQYYQCAYVPDSSWEPVMKQKTCLLYPRPIKKMQIMERHPVMIIGQGMVSEKIQTSFSGERMYKAYLSARPWTELVPSAPFPCRLPSDQGIFFAASQSTEEGIYLVLDMGEEECGYLNLDLRVPAGTRVDIAFGEHLDDLRVRSFTFDCIRNFAGVFYGSGKRDNFVHYFKRIGCRYLQLHINANEFTLYYAGLLPAYYPVHIQKAPSFSEFIDQKIYDTGIRTLRLCMHEHYEDCPWREQALYAMDSRNQMLCGYYAFHEFVFARESIQLLALGQRPNGLLELCAPALISVTIPAFSLIWILELQEYVDYSQDVLFGETMLPVAEKILHFFRERQVDGLCTFLHDNEYWNFYDWQSGLVGSEEDINGLLPDEIRFDAPLCAFYILALDAFGKLARKCGLNEKEKACENEKQEMSARTVTMFWDGERNCFASYFSDGKQYHFCELTQSLFLCAGICDKKTEPDLARLLLTPDSALLPVTLSYKIFYYDALIHVSNSYVKNVFEDIRNVWGNMICKGATSFWETSEGACAFGSAGSLCHGWSAIPVYYYHRYETKCF